MRVVRLTRAGADLVDRWLGGEPVGSGSAESALASRLVDAAILHPVAEPASLDDVTVVVPVRDDPAGLERLLAGLERFVPVIVSDDGSADPAAVAAAAARHGAALVSRPADRDSGADPATRPAGRGSGADPAAGPDDPGPRTDPAAGPDSRGPGTHLAAGSEGCGLGADPVIRAAGRGPGAARNAGLAEVTTGVVAFVDADATITPEALAVLAGHLADPAVAAAAPRVRSRIDKPGLLAFYESVHSPLDLGPEPSPVGPGRRVRYVPAAALIVRTAAARAVGGFDTSLAWGEDVDFVWRLADAGHVVRYDPAAVAWHRPRPNWSAWFEQRRRYGGSAPELARRHGRAAAAARCSPWSFGVWGAAAAGHPLIAAAAAAASGAVLARRLRSRSVPGWPRLALELTARSHLRAGVGLARALFRAWWPMAAAAAAFSPWARRVVAAAAVVPALADWARSPKPAGPAAAVGLRMADDLAYGLGLWEAMLSGRRTEGSEPAAIRLSTEAIGLDLAWTARPDLAEATGPEPTGAARVGA